jgi:hydroxyacyl-ACP dehydratase HTD2-like protein with hotdog domain
MTEIDRTLIGGWSEPFHYHVEAGAVRKFAAAIGDPNPLYHDEQYARAAGYAGIVAPPTFPACFRPRADPPWIAVLDRRRIVAGETAFDYEAPLVVGLRVTCRAHFKGIEDKQGKKGAMQLLLQETEARDEAGRLLVTIRRSTIYRSLEQVTHRSLA